MRDKATVAGPTLTIFPSRREERRTICVIGAPRGGTSMVAGILRKLDIHMGDDIDDSSNEDLAFLTHGGVREIFQQPERDEERKRYLQHATGIVLDRNVTHQVWGWKDPLSAFYVSDLLPHLTNLCFIFVTRDPGAIAQRERLEEGVIGRRNLLAYIRLVGDVYTRITRLIDQRSRPTLLISYERALRAPVETGRAIVDFVGAAAPPSFDEWLVDYIAPDRMDAALELQPRAHSLRTQFGATAAIEAFIDESARARREGMFNDTVVNEANIVAVTNKLFETTVSQLNGGEYMMAQDSALSIINLFNDQFPSLKDGALGAIVEQTIGGGEEVKYPDVVAGAFYLLGISCLLQTSGQRALINFCVAERMMRRRLELQLPTSILSASNYWSCIFHKGMAAKAVGRKDLLQRVRNDLAEASSEKPPSWALPLGTTGLAEAARRAADL